MPVVTYSTDVQTSAEIVVDPTSTNPQAVVQTSTLGVHNNGGVDDDGFVLSTTVNGADVETPINIVIAIDSSGSANSSSGTDFDGDGSDESIFEAELIAAQELFDAYAAAGYSPDEVTFSLVDYSNSATIVGSYTLGESGDFTTALSDMAAAGTGGRTNFDAALDTSIQALTDIGATSDETNIVVFMSDGKPTSGGTTFSDEVQTLEDTFNASVAGIGIGASSDLDELNKLDNTGGADQVLTGAALAELVVQPLTDIDFLRFEIEITGIDENGDPLSQTVTLNEGDPEVIATPTGWSFSDLAIDEQFQVGSELTVNVTSVFAEDPGNPGSGEQLVPSEHVLNVVVCFAAGTMILTRQGDRPIETLEVGDIVITRDHGPQEIRWIGATTFPSSYVAANPMLRPVLIRRDAIAPDIPTRDLRVSRQHRILISDWRAELLFGEPDGVLTPAFTLCNDSTIIQERPTKPVTYLHMAFDQHEVIFANGLEAESFHPADRTVAGLSSPLREELLRIFPELENGFAYEAARQELRVKEAVLLARKI